MEEALVTRKGCVAEYLASPKDGFIAVLRHDVDPERAGGGGGDYMRVMFDMEHSAHVHFLMRLTKVKFINS